MYISNDDTQNYPFCSLKLVVETFEHLTYLATNQNSLKSPKLISTNALLQCILYNIMFFVQKCVFTEV